MSWPLQKRSVKVQCVISTPLVALKKTSKIMTVFKQVLNTFPFFLWSDKQTSSNKQKVCLIPLVGQKLSTSKKVLNIYIILQYMVYDYKVYLVIIISNLALKPCCNKNEIEARPLMIHKSQIYYCYLSPVITVIQRRGLITYSYPDCSSN